MSHSTIILLVLTILLIATLTRSTLGFGDALVAMPLLTLTVGIHIAVPVVALMGVTIGLVIAINNWRDIDFAAAWQLVLASALGVPIGLLLLWTAPEAWVKGILGILLILFSIYALTRPALPQIEAQHWAYSLGFISGILGGAYNINGPPIVIYGTLRRWSPASFRVTLQGYFVPSFFFIALGHGITGLWTPDVVQLYLAALPLIFIAIYFGGKLNRRIPVERFTRLLHIALIVLGALLLI